MVAVAHFVEVAEAGERGDILGPFIYDALFKLAIHPPSRVQTEQQVRILLRLIRSIGFITLASAVQLLLLSLLQFDRAGLQHPVVVLRIQLQTDAVHDGRVQGTRSCRPQHPWRRARRDAKVAVLVEEPQNVRIDLRWARARRNGPAVLGAQGGVVSEDVLLQGLALYAPPPCPCTLVGQG